MAHTSNRRRRSRSRSRSRRRSPRRSRSRSRRSSYGKTSPVYDKWQYLFQGSESLQRSPTMHRSVKRSHVNEPIETTVIETKTEPVITNIPIIDTAINAITSIVNPEQKTVDTVIIDQKIAEINKTRMDNLKAIEANVNELIAKINEINNRPYNSFIDDQYLVQTTNAINELKAIDNELRQYGVHIDFIINHDNPPSTPEVKQVATALRDNQIETIRMSVSDIIKTFQQRQEESNIVGKF